MNNKYKLMLQPYVLPNGVTIKNRLSSGPAILSYGQANEPFPNQEMMLANINKAKSGAAIIAVHGCDPMYNQFNYRTGMIHEHGVNWDMYNHQCQHVIGTMVQSMHDYGSKVLSIQYFDPFIMAEGPYDVSTGIPTPWVYGDDTEPRYDMIECPKEVMYKAMDQLVKACVVLKKEIGFDGLWTGMAYRHTFLGRLLSPITNKRTDEFGGSLENRSRFILECFRRIKEACGRDFIIEASISGHDPLGEEGFTLDEACEFAKSAEGVIDILMIKGPTIDETHPTQFDVETPYLYMAERVKNSNPKLAVETIGGFINPDTVEAVLESDKADIVSMARTWISNMEYVRCIQEDRTEDIVPCIKCNKCHRTSNADPWVSNCSVNPVYGSASLVNSCIKAAARTKKVAVIGGGPAGLEAARICFDRGHNVTIYEKSEALGGLINVTKNVSFKWPLQRFCEYLIRQVEKRDIQVKLNCIPTVDMLKREKYDHVIVAIGSSPLLIPVEGIDGKNVITALDAYKCYDELDKELVIIGGGEIGIETGMYLTKQGKKVVILEMSDKPAKDSTPIHYYIMFKHAWEACNNLEIRCNAKVSRITMDGVYYTDVDGQTRFVKCGNVVLAAGMQSNTREALSYYDGSYGFDIIGDCKKVGSVQTLMRSAFYTASSI